MIKNIVFDCGNVLIKWEPREIAHLIIPNDFEAAEALFKYVIGSKDFYMWDKGELTDEEFASFFKAKLPKEYKYVTEPFIEKFSLVIPLKLDVIDFAHKLIIEGYNVYLLSNYNIHFLDMVNRLSIKDEISGYVYSAKNHHIKPGREIYQELMDTYNLKKEECFFIDDLKANVDASISFGFKDGYVFDDNLIKLYDAIKNATSK